MIPYQHRPCQRPCRTWILSIVILLAFRTASDAQDLPRIIQPSPEAASLFRYQDYPMDYSTGLPQISIPLYEVKSGTLSVPVSLSYHASGRRVYDQDGPVALGWSLNAGGMISREIYGGVDFGTTARGTFKFPYPFNTTNVSNYSNLPYLEQLMHFDKNPDDAPISTWLDGEYDVFSYYFNDRSGKFIFKDNNNVKTPALMPYKPYVITPHYTVNGLTGIDILDDKGVLYQFLGTESTIQSQSVTETVPATTGYALSKIISADKSDTIYFQYTGFSQTRTTISQQIVWNDNEQNVSSSPGGVAEGPTTNENTGHSPYTIGRLTEIDYRQGKLVFNLVSGTDKIDNITIYNSGNQVIRSIQINRTAMDNLAEIGYSTNKLDNLVFKDKTGGAVEKYAFAYYPSYNASPGFNVRYRDWWGFYTGSGISSMVPYYTGLQYIANNGTNIQYNYTVGNPATNREPNLAGVESGILKTITYPTGGTTSYTYEKNAYYSFAAQQIKSGPGLRVSLITTNDINGNTSYKTYTYGDNESGYGSLDMEPAITNMAVEYTDNYLGDGAPSYSYRIRNFNSDFLPGISDLANRPVVYSTVTEYQGTTTDNIGKTVYNYDYQAWGPSGMPSFESSTIQRMHIYNYNYWNVPALLKRTDYKAYPPLPGTTGPSYQPRKQVVNTYNATTLETVSAIHVQRVHTIPQPDRLNATPALYAEPYAAVYLNPHMNIYTYSDYQIPIGYKNLATVTETAYNEDGSTATSTISYTYNARAYPSQTARNTSDGGNTISQTTYPFDYSGNAVLTQMADPSINMLGYPIEEKELKNTTPIKATRTNYYNFQTQLGAANPIILPQTIDVQKGVNPYETRLRYYSYDPHSNPISVSKENDVLHAYIWDYKKTYPIAEILNASPLETAYTSFESDGTGGWTGILPANIRNDVAGITGKKYYMLGTSTPSAAGLNTANSYLVSYWSRSGACTIPGTAAGWPKNGRTTTINGVGWTYYEHKVSGVSTITISGTASIDELRLYPANAQMSSFVFEPLVGMSAQCDVNNRIIYYEYDGFGRLLLMKDLNGQILKTFKYQYQFPTP